jgi:hypothetical protein
VTVLREGEVDERMRQRRTYVDRRPVPPLDHSNVLMGLAIVTLLTMGMMLGWFWWAVGDRDPVSAQPPPAAPTPVSPPGAPDGSGAAAAAPTAVATPPAPISNQLRSRDWLLSPYAIVSADGELQITGTLTNLGNSPDSTRIRVFVYRSGDPIAQGTQDVVDVPADSAVEIALPTGAAWVSGSKVLLVQAEELPPS